MDPYRENIEPHEAVSKFPTVSKEAALQVAQPLGQQVATPERTVTTQAPLQTPAATLQNQVPTPQRAASLERNVLPKSPLETIRTYQADAAALADKEKPTAISLALAEQKKRGQQGTIRNSRPATPEQKNRRYKIMIAASAFFMAGGLVALGFLYARFSLQNQPIIDVPEAEQLITVDSTIDLGVTDQTSEALRQTLATTVATTERGVSGIIFTKTIAKRQERIGAQEVFTSLKMPVPADFARSLSAGYTLGAITTDTGAAPFIILKPTSFETAFPGMLAWEPTLASTFYSTFNVQLDVDISRFSDVVIKNTDARIQRNSRGSALIVYALHDRSTLVITTSESALAELITRLTSTSYIPR